MTMPLRSGSTPRRNASSTWRLSSGSNPRNCSRCSSRNARLRPGVRNDQEHDVYGAVPRLERELALERLCIPESCLALAAGLSCSDYDQRVPRTQVTGDRVTAPRFARWPRLGAWPGTARALRDERHPWLDLRPGRFGATTLRPTAAAALTAWSMVRLRSSAAFDPTELSVRHTRSFARSRLADSGTEAGGQDLRSDRGRNIARGTLPSPQRFVPCRHWRSVAPVLSHRLSRGLSRAC